MSTSREVLLPYGLLGERLVSVDKVADGLACNCTCPACHQPLIARQGARNVHHFAHANGTTCPHAAQTTAHILAKNILAQELHMSVPVAYTMMSTERFIAFEEQDVRFMSVALEQRLSSIVPDVVATKEDGTQLIVEIKVKHAVDDGKLDKIRKLGTDAIEVAIDAEDFYDSGRLREHLLGSVSGKHWLYCRAAQRERERLFLTAQRIPIVQHGFAIHTAWCPTCARMYHGESYANVVDDCIGCDNLLTIGNDDGSIDGEVWCLAPGPHEASQETLFP
ncbi:MAG TPA: hypothetical protein VFB98_08800 [Candidatus Deferrimicrobium sp.]|nr:hypothetical protein [Candidatus Deferrimicrobium sp.]